MLLFPVTAMSGNCTSEIVCETFFGWLNVTP